MKDCFAKALAVLLACLSVGVGPVAASPVPDEIVSSHFVVTVNGVRMPVMHAAMNLYFLNFPASPHAAITVTAETDGFWDRGVEVQPWRMNLRPQREGRTISFTLDGAAKLSISRPGDFFSDSEMLYLFANPQETSAPTATTPGVRYFGPGLHHENIDAASGDRIYLAPGAVVFGSLNLWQVNNVSVSGRGIIVYDGPQNPADDDGWMHKRNWHCIVMDQAHDIHIEGVTCVVRSRTWQVQMKDSHNIEFNNVKIIGANSGNANADGMDWLGGGDTLVKDSFIRAADDVFALQTSWDGYGPVAFAKQGKPVSNIRIQGGVFSTSISNIVRAGWPEKNYEGGDFSMTDADIIHMGMGGCGIPFALMELWADPNGRGQSAGFHFDRIRMEDWYSLAQFEEPVEGVSDISFTDVMGLESPSLVESTLKGKIHTLNLDTMVLAGEPAMTDAAIPLVVKDGAEAPTFAPSFASVHIKATEGLVKPGRKIHFEAITATRSLRFDWFFGDGQGASGRRTSHRFADTEGTLLDGSGRFRVLLKVSNGVGRELWVYAPVVVSAALKPALAVQPDSQPGLQYSYTESAVQDAGPREGVAKLFALSEVPRKGQAYKLSFEGDLAVPVDGGYSFLLVANEEAFLEIDGVPAAQSLAPIAQVCGLAGSAARLLRASAPLAHGTHHIRVTETHAAGKDDLRFLWQGPGFALQPVNAALWTHPSGPGSETSAP